MRYKRIAFRIWETLFLAEAGLLFVAQWQHALAWLNPLLVGIGFHSMSRSRRLVWSRRNHGSHSAPGLPLEPVLRARKELSNVEHTLSPGQLEAIRRLGTCAVSNAIESFDVRLRNEGLADSSIRSMFPHLPPMLGYAVTARIRCSSPPPVGHNYHDRTDWWTSFLTVPAPRVVVIQDIDPKPGFGAFVGEVHASIQRALGSVGAVTNGAVRDLQAVEAAGYPVVRGQCRGVPCLCPHGGIRRTGRSRRIAHRAGRSDLRR